MAERDTASGESLYQVRPTNNAERTGNGQEPEGRNFESLRARHIYLLKTCPNNPDFFSRAAEAGKWCVVSVQVWDQQGAYHASKDASASRNMFPSG